MVDRHGVRPDPKAVEAVSTWKALRTDTQLMSFLGFANYYREFIKRICRQGVSDAQADAQQKEKGKSSNGAMKPKRPLRT